MVIIVNNPPVQIALNDAEISDALMEYVLKHNPELKGLQVKDHAHSFRTKDGEHTGGACVSLWTVLSDD